MNKIIERIGILIFLIGSFIYANKTVEVVNSFDEIMIKINEEKSNYENKVIDSTYNNDAMIIGINGKIVDVKKSYEIMKQVGLYDAKLYKYKTIKKKLNNKYYINGSKKNISLIFKVYKNSNLQSVINILNKYNKKGNIFVEYNYFSKNSQYVMNVLDNNYVIGYLGNNNDYSDSNYNLMNTLIKNLGKQKNFYCYSENRDKNILDICSKDNNYSVNPSIIIKKYPYIELKKSIKDGSIISFIVDDKLIEELPLILDYLNSAEYTVSSLNELIDM